MRMPLFDHPPRSEARLSLHGTPGAEHLQWTFSLRKYDAQGIPHATLLDYGTITAAELPEDLHEALWATLVSAVPREA